MAKSFTFYSREEALQIAEKRREAKGKGEKERCTHLSAEFERIARRDKKAFLSDQSKEIEENNKMGKTRDLFKKIRDTKGIFQAKMGTIKDRKAMEDYPINDMHSSTKIPRKRKKKGRRTNIFYLIDILTKLVEVMAFQLSYFKS